MDHFFDNEFSGPKSEPQAPSPKPQAQYPCELNLATKTPFEHVVRCRRALELYV